MGVDITVYKWSKDNPKNEVGDCVYDFCKDCNSILGYLKGADGSNYFPSLGIGVFRLNLREVDNLKVWLMHNRSEDWRYDSLLEILEHYDGELFIYANW